MKCFRFVPSVLLMFVSTLTLTFAQSMVHKSDVRESDAQKAFETIKTLAGNWHGPVTVDPPQHGETEDTGMEVSMRVTSRGNALVHEMKGAGLPEDPTRYDHPVTMLYLDGDRLLLTHYCDAGNRPRMAGKVSPDGKKVEFDFLDLSGGNEHGHMDHAVFTIVDANHHTEDWIYMMPGNKPLRARFDLQRTK